MLTEVYSQAHIRAILRGLGLKIVGETHNDFLCMCPFHGNRNTPSFTVSQRKGVYLCFNPSCDASGTVADLVKKLGGYNEFETLRYIASCKNDDVDFEDELLSVLDTKPDFVEFPQATLDKLNATLHANSDAQGYLIGRGITEDLFDYFEIGYSAKQDMITVPLHSPDGMPVGLIGRSIHGKSFKNSQHLPRSKTLFNLHRAKRFGGTAIVCESSFDAIRLHGAGYPYAVATLGGYLSQENFANLDRYFSRIILMTDFDQKLYKENCRKCLPDLDCHGHNAGRDLAQSIADKLPMKEVLWAAYSDEEVYPHGAKDVGDMTNEEIRQCVSNAKDNFEYATLNLY